MTLEEKLEKNIRLDFEDGVKLYDLDVITLGYYANKIREQKHQKKTYFNINRHINPTNICKDVCQFCAYSATRKNPNQYTLTHEEMIQTVRDSSKNGIKEVHIVSAHNPHTGLQWYMDIFKKIKKEFPSIHIKALTAAEIHFLSSEYNLSYEELIDTMIQSGVDSMPGGGAEIFDEKIRKRICGGKVSSEDWLKIHELWHKRGKKSNATMLFGHIESKEHRVDHILRLRELQDKTGGFNAFIPLVFQTENNYLKVKEPITANEILKTYAISRLLLDNIPNIKAYWATSTVKLALIAQEFGANDVDGTIEKESIQSAAGAASKNGVSVGEFIDLIKNSGFIPVERDSIYNELKIY
ncbi:aminofutalosine synthase MqnE [Aliarcobacter skirrowii]|jgi:aminodeoxyfutalosine synthase|uniref:Aminodeoxyfutalosine synthase n=1 Tax=Aliarcobacter skirrowii CCUG 10374 TaxID=1032239 RepID=A0AAD0WPB3_9BACT|nr:aminofutalosine synthase MqnE [Aliarcobacter skirrowii]AXX85556.1 menaquinone biosynthesis protein, SCO4494 family [Aliarcobacter skirrowii CCUG 10374]AZL54618.1 aminofutalosine synthase MqnE [Aliarcobacter skirrowii]KAB0621035.1 aminofutalosine synthase MqnE [Aliarcobacter skirrowii CCUG 10374]MDD3025152.1 aminofutalosine synthase MqnE [Aliarcobacter skirrowii]RXI26208.1 aminofutalosine synthase MqnE [Aliarcobacter skirrowii CCUG 10374]